MVCINGFAILLERNISQVDGGAKMSHSRHQESGTFSISAAFPFSIFYLSEIDCHSWHLRAVSEATWQAFGGSAVGAVILGLVRWPPELLPRDCPLVFQTRNSCKIGSCVDLRTECIFTVGWVLCVSKAEILHSELWEVIALQLRR